MTRWPITVPKGSRAIQQQRRDERNENLATLPPANGIVITARSHLADAPIIEAMDLDKAERLVRAKP